MEYKIAICDDEQTERQYLSSLVKKWALREKYTVEVSVFKNAEAFLFRYAEEKDYDILLLDIEMGDLDGVGLAKKIRTDNGTVQILFITAYPDFIAEGYEVSALHYLMKPVDENRLFAILDRAAVNLGKTERYEVFNIDGEAVRIAVDSVICVEAFAHCVVVTTTKEQYRLNETISKMEKLLGDGFIRCHRSYLVSIKYMKRITKTDVVLDSDEKVPLARRKYDAVNKAFIRYYAQAENEVG